MTRIERAERHESGRGRSAGVRYDPAVFFSPDFSQAAAEAGFRPPTAEQMQEHIDAHPPRAASRWKRLLPLAPMGLGLGLYLAAPSGATALVLLGCVAGSLAWSAVLARASHQRRERLQQMHEKATLRRPEEALRIGWDLLPEVNESPLMYGSLLTTFGRCLSELQRDNAAMVCYDRLLESAPSNHPAAKHFACLRALAALFDDRLAEADDSLRRIRVEDEPEGSPLRSTVGIARLLQQARTYRVDDIIENRGDAIDRMRPLGVEAGYAYALIAWAHEQRRRQPREHDDVHSLADQVRVWWERATTLLPAAVIARRLPETAELAATPPPPNHDG
jgi:tetratricopeptide (TPR) repeat protein